MNTQAAADVQPQLSECDSEAGGPQLECDVAGSVKMVAELEEQSGLLRKPVIHSAAEVAPIRL